MASKVDIGAWRAVLLAQSRTLRAIERDLEASGAMSLSWYDVLLELDAAPGRRLRMQDLAARAVVSRPRVSRIVSELESAGYLERCADPTDGRASVVTITKAGRAMFRRTAPIYLDGIERHFNRHLAAEDHQQIETLLTPVVDAHQAELDLRR
jgi:DNA-binding MarR family transcriptional regulator